MSSGPRAGIPRSPCLVLLGLACALAGRAQAQRLGQQDRLDFQVPASVVQGSGARAFGMGGAFLARADDATAASWNPAGLSYLRRPEVSAVWTTSRFNSDTSSVASGAAIESQLRRGDWPDFLSGAWPIRIRSLSGAAQVSYQRAISFTNTRTIESLDDRRVDAQSSGGFDVLALGTGLQVARRLRLGLTVNSWLNGFEQNLQRRTPTVNSDQQLDFDLSGWNAHFGLLYSPVPSLNVGAAFKSPFEASVRLARERIDEGDPPTANSFARDDVRLGLPGALGVGLSWRVRSTLTVSADYTRTFWSKSRIYNFFTLGRCADPPDCPVPELVGDPTEETEGPGGGFYPVLPYPTLTEDQRDTEELRAGLEYVILKQRFKWPLRVGAFTDRQYFSDASGHAPRFRGLTVGTGVIVGPVMLDAAYVYEWGSYTTSSGDEAVETQVRSRRLLLSAIYRHGGR